MVQLFSSPSIKAIVVTLYRSKCIHSEVQHAHYAVVQSDSIVMKFLIHK